MHPGRRQPCKPPGSLKPSRAPRLPSTYGPRRFTGLHARPIEPAMGYRDALARWSGRGWAGRSRRMIRRGMPLATAPVLPTTRNPARSNIDLVPTNAMVRSIRPGGSTGCASTAGAPWEAA